VSICQRPAQALDAPPVVGQQPLEEDHEIALACAVSPGGPSGLNGPSGLTSGSGLLPALAIGERRRVIRRLR
jgi:hypothetical protein